MSYYKPLFALFVTLAAQCHSAVNPEYVFHQKEVNATKLGEDVAVYAYPLVSMGLLRQRGIYAATPGQHQAPINQFAHELTQPTPLTTRAFPCIDTLSSTAWLDLAHGPMVLQIPISHKRFYMFELFDGWTNVLTTIDTNTAYARNFFIYGPNFKGPLPKDMLHIRSSTNIVYINGMTQCFGPGDYENINKIQQSYMLVPYNQFGRPYTAPFAKLPSLAATREASYDQINEMNSTSYFNRFADLLRINPPGPQDVAICRALDDLGLCPQETFNTEKVNRSLENGLEYGLINARQKIERGYGSVYTKRNRWEMILRKESDFGTDYMRRAFLARASLPASLSQNILTMSIDADRDGNRFHGTQKYLYHIPRCDLPPVGAFWSLSIYNDVDMLVANPANIYAIQSFSDTLHYNEDGSLDIWIQQEKPHSTKANWLPCPNNGYTLVFRLYKPADKAIDGNWTPPQLRCLDPFSD
ncbi:MAG: DUF1254 domain-containing protein [Verrucomicrobia bacterium]|nr:DUF1254 domain-containing protein [Verrucomicrobiota bacterium]MBS0636024.1 DUF1254 domain-containing protein [Verrucomicrobiota bacterium]